MTHFPPGPFRRLAPAQGYDSDTPVVQRFQIEDLIVQDESGVVFRAFDSQAGQTVALRRFFPRGAAGGGLSGDEQIAYNRALERLVGVQHPSLRTVICGGCDPVDGVPFMATEWIEGAALPQFLGDATLAAHEVAGLLGQALKICQRLSEVLAEEAVWVEMELQSIVLGAQGSDRGATFCVSPFKCLGNHSQERGLESMIGLAEELIGRNGRATNDQADKGLAGWLHWLRGAAKTTSLREARETLTASMGAKVPVPTKHPSRQTAAIQRTPPQAVATQKKPRSRAPLVIITASLLMALGLGGWTLSRRGAVARPSQTTNAFEIMDFADLKLDSVPAAASKQAARIPKATPPKSVPSADVSGRVRVFTVADYDLLMGGKNEEVLFEGTFRSIAFSSTGKTMYLLFSENASSGEPRGGVLLSAAAADLTEEFLKPLTGKKIRLQGKVKVEGVPRPGRPIIFIKDRASIKEVK